MKDDKGVYYVVLASLLLTWVMFTIDYAVATSDNDWVKPAEKDYVNVKPVWPSCVCVAIYTYSYTIIYIFIYSKCKFNVELYWIIRMDHLM